MQFFRKPNLPSDVSGIDSRLRRRPELDEHRVELIAARARDRARANADTSKEPFLRSRLAILLMLTLGFGFSGAGVGLAVTAATDDPSAAELQYGQPGNDGDDGETLEPTQPTIDEQPDDGVKGVIDEEPKEPTSGAAPEQEVAPTQETRQLGADVSATNLPFTGFAAIPVLLLGLALLTTGFVMRRRGSDS